MIRPDIFHYDGLTYWSPLDPARMDLVLDLLALAPGDPVIDVGCGRAELLIRLIERHGVHATGVDRSSAALEQARGAAAGRIPAGALRLIEADASELSVEPGSMACVSSLGGPYIGDSHASTLDAYASWLGPGGYLLVGHGFWARPPDPDYLAATGIPREAFTDHEGNIHAGQQRGLTLLHSCVSDRDEWDAFEGRIHDSFERAATDDPHDAELHSELTRRRAWFEAYERWGRETMGFGLYLFRAPAHPS